MAMPLEITPTELRKNVYKLLDKILESGVPIEVKRKGKRLLITPAILTVLSEIQKILYTWIGLKNGRLIYDLSITVHWFKVHGFTG
jgi:hypothetical protein